VVDVEPGCEALSQGLGSESPGLGGVFVEGCCASALRFLSHGLGGAGRPGIISQVVQFKKQKRPRASTHKKTTETEFRFIPDMPVQSLYMHHLG
jgi:hypothetical protein